MEITLVHTHTHNIGYDSASQIPGHIESRMKWRHCRMNMALRSMAIRWCANFPAQAGSSPINPRSANGPGRLALVVAIVGATHAVWRQGRPGRTKTGRRTTTGNLFLQANPIVMLMIESLSLNMKHVVMAVASAIAL
jgi:hypothetical protein